MLKPRTPAQTWNQNRYLSNLHTSTIHSDKTCGVRYLGLGGRKIDDWKKRWEEEEEDIGRGGEGREGKEEQKSIV